LLLAGTKHISSSIIPHFISAYLEELRLIRHSAKDERAPQLPFLDTKNKTGYNLGLRGSAYESQNNVHISQQNKQELCERRSACALARGLQRRI
jgi:hypothetical protein